MIAHGSTFRRSTAIIGAGLAGLTAAERLAARGRSVVVFEKSRGAGGRSARRCDRSGEYDHGAQFFTARDPRFVKEVARWCEKGLARQWTGRIATIGAADRPVANRFVGVPGMNEPIRAKSRAITTYFGAQVTSVERTSLGWSLWMDDDTTHGGFDELLVTAPAPQAASLMAPVAPMLAARAASVRMSPCWAMMLRLPTPLPVEFDAAFVRDGGPISWLARNGSKPGRSGDETWVVHASAAWSSEHLEAGADWAARQLTRSLADVVGSALPSPASCIAHRWRYARTTKPLGAECLYDAGLRLGVAGDWCLGDRFECAYLSGRALADRVANTS